MMIFVIAWLILGLGGWIFDWLDCHPTLAPGILAIPIYLALGPIPLLRWIFTR